MPLHLIADLRVHRDRAGNRLESVPPSMVRLHIRVIDADFAHPFRQTFTHLLVLRVARAALASLGGVVEDRPLPALLDHSHEALFDQVVV